MTAAPTTTTTTPDLWLPAPPTDEEKYWYLGPQHRWLLIVQSFSFALIGVSVLRFSLSDARLLLFLVPLSLFTVALAVSLLSSTRRRRVDRLDHELRVETYAPSVWPSVDVFLPSAGEPMEVLDNTYQHVAALAWPGPVRVYVLDDAARPEVARLAEAHGFDYGSRPDRGRLKKAGNLRYGYERSAGDLIAIFDADFVPRHDFLAELVPYFEQEDVGIVQSPQFFDARPGMGWLQRCAGATQELFYRWIQPARDRSDAAICVGTCALYRRAGLDAAGGFAQIGHSEDVHTGVNLMKVGFRLRYVPVLVSKGLCPDDVGAFLNQQYRWCTGSMSLLRDKAFHDNPLITTRQRLCFWAGFLYYLTTGLNVFVTGLPALAMVWLLPDYVRPSNSRFLLGALVMWAVVLPVMFRSRWRVDVLRVQTLYSFAHAVAIFDILTGRTKEWVATGAGSSSNDQPAEQRRRSTPVGVTVLRVAKSWIGLSQLLLWSGLALDVHRHGLAHFWAMLTFAAVSAYVMVPILLLPSPAARTPERRRTVVLPDHPDYAPPRRARLAAAVRRRLPDGPRPTGLPRFRKDIQGLRAIAVLMVVLYHAHVPGIYGGYVGVDVFFVISGFLITGNLLRQVEREGRIRFGAFYAGRFRRLAVPAALVVVVTVLAVRAWDSLFQVRGVTTDALWTALYGMNYHLAEQGINYQQANGQVSPLQHFWSLAVEEQFYVLWPLLIMLAVWVGRRHRRGLLVLVVAAVTAGSFLVSLQLTDSNQPLAYLSFPTRAWELGAGALLATVATRLARMPRALSVPLSWAGLAGIVGSGLAYDDRTLFPGTAALLPVLATVAVIAAGCRPTWWGAGLVLDRRPAQWLGLVSYPWYLWHWPLLVVLPLRLSYEVTWTSQLQIVVLALWFAVLTHHLLERPLGRSRRPWPAWLGGGALVAGALVLVAVAVAATVPSLVGSGRAVQVTAANTGEVMQALTTGVETKAAPANLTPSLDKVADDQPASSFDGCHADFLVVHQGDCVYGDPQGGRTMVLFGDSHAQQWLPGLDAAATKLGWKLVVWTKAACPVAEVSITSRQLGNRAYSECDAWRAETLDRIDGLHPDVVLVSQSDLVAGDQVSDTEWAERTAETLSRLRSHGNPVVYVGDTPVPTHDVPTCVADHLADVQACTYPSADAYAAYPGRAATLASTLTAAQLAEVSPAAWFCTTRDCPAVVGNLMLFRDATHISTAYSAYLAPALEGLFVPRIN